MSEELIPIRGRFVAGHAKVGGRKRSSASRVREMIEQLGPSADPILFLLKTIRDRTYTYTSITPDGKKKKITEPAPLSLVIECSKIVAQYYVPKLTAIAHTNSEHDGPVEIEHTSLIEIMADPALCAAGQEIALRMAEVGVEPKQVAAPYIGLREPSNAD